MSLHALGVAEAAAAIAAGRISAADLVADCLSRIREVDNRIEAWAFLDPDHAMAQARAADEHRALGRILGPLHGVPVGIKDIFDTSDFPTENGSALWKGRTPRRDAGAVARLRAAGAIVLGKTVTTEYAWYHPGKTRNPHDPQRTPGGSSSGSAAAVAAQMVPGAIGSQTNGSVIRPASFCGVVGFKPTHGLITRAGALALSRTLDHVGVFARSVTDAAMLCDVLAGFDAADPDTRPLAFLQLAATAASDPPLAPRLAFVKGPAWQAGEPVLDQSFEALQDLLGENMIPVDLGSAFERVVEFHDIVLSVEAAHNLKRDFEKNGDALSAPLRGLIERGRQRRAVDYLDARIAADFLNDQLEHVFDEYDAIITAAAPGEAPVGISSTGDPVFCTTWSYLGTPAVSLPLLRGGFGLPIGVQLVGRRGNDARLLRTANWLSAMVATPQTRRKQVAASRASVRRTRKGSQ